MYDEANTSPTESDFVAAADASHPIFNGPFTPVTTDLFRAARSGPRSFRARASRALILGRVNDDEQRSPVDPNRIVLARVPPSCSGLTLIGGMTPTTSTIRRRRPRTCGRTSIHYAVNAAVDTCAPTSASSGCVSTTEVGVTVTDNSGGSGPASVRYTVDGGAEQTVATPDASGNARIVVAAGEHPCSSSGVDQAGNASRRTPAP